MQEQETTVEQLTEAQAIAEHVCRMLMEGGQTIPTFAEGNIPVKIAAKIMGKTPQWVQFGIINGWFPVGYATLDGELVTNTRQIRSNRRVDYTIIPKMFWEVTGYVWQGKEHAEKFLGKEV